MGAIQALSGKPINTKRIFTRVFLLGRCVLFKFISFSFSPWHFCLFAPPPRLPILCFSPPFPHTQEQHRCVCGVCLQPQCHITGFQGALQVPGELAFGMAALPKPQPRLPGKKQNKKKSHLQTQNMYEKLVYGSTRICQHVRLATRPSLKWRYIILYLFVTLLSS